jgi:hypothetical protein
MFSYVLSGSPSSQGSRSPTSLSMNKGYLFLLLSLPTMAAIPGKKINTCVEEVSPLFSEFVPTDFEDGRSTVGIDQVQPVKAKIRNFIISHPQLVITEVSVVSTSSHAPFYTTIAAKRVIDPKSKEKGLQLAGQRAEFIGKMLEEIKLSGSEFSKITYQVKAEMAGPEFQPKDLNDRFVTPLSPNYSDRVNILFDTHRKLYEEQSLLKKPDPLKDASKYPNLFQTKFKPFEGFRIAIHGHKKDQMKCSGQILKTPQFRPSRTIRQ